MRSIASILTDVFTGPGWRKTFVRIFHVSERTADRLCAGQTSLPAEKMAELMAHSEIAEARFLALVEAEKARIAHDQVGVRCGVGAAQGAVARDGSVGKGVVASPRTATGLAATARAVVRADRAGREAPVTP